MNSIVEQIKNSPTGGTASLTSEKLPTTGYFVGGLAYPLIIEPDDSPADRREMLDEFVEYLIRHPQAHYVGWWTDEETGKLWVDGTTWHETEFEAGRVGRGRREIAIYDIARQRELRLTHVEGE